MGHPYTTWSRSREEVEDTSKPSKRKRKWLGSITESFSRLVRRKGNSTEAIEVTETVEEEGEESNMTETVHWPRDLLPKDLPNIRILTYGYNADVAKAFAATNQNGLFDHAKNLLESLERNRKKSGAVRILESLVGDILTDCRRNVNLFLLYTVLEDW